MMQMWSHPRLLSMLRINYACRQAMLLRFFCWPCILLIWKRLLIKFISLQFVSLWLVKAVKLYCLFDKHHTKIFSCQLASHFLTASFRINNKKKWSTESSLGGLSKPGLSNNEFEWVCSLHRSYHGFGSHLNGKANTSEITVFIWKSDFK